MTDHYSTLGLSKDATPDDIKRAYRKLASQHHPDKGGDKEKFQEIQQAYGVLSDPEKKAEYDNPRPQRSFDHQEFNFGGIPPEFEHIFGGHFGDMFGHRMHRAPRNKVLNLQVTISLEQAFHGHTLASDIRLPSGKIQSINVKIPAGIHSDVIIKLQELGDDSIAGQPRGDIHLTVNVQQHSIFQRNGDDLITDINVDIWDALLGKVIHIDTIDGKKLEVKIPPGIQMGQILSIPQAGMVNMNDNRYRGRLLLKTKITIPANLSDRQKELVKQIKESN